MSIGDRYDRDPAALAWARAKIQESVTRAEECAANKLLPAEQRERWRSTAAYMRRDLLDREGVVHAAFDERWPATLAAIAPAPFTCPRCTRTSHHPDDKRYGYCGHCHDYTGAPTP